MRLKEKERKSKCNSVKHAFFGPSIYYGEKNQFLCFEPYTKSDSKSQY